MTVVLASREQTQVNELLREFVASIEGRTM